MTVKMNTITTLILMVSHHKLKSDTKMAILCLIKWRVCGPFILGALGLCKKNETIHSTTKSLPMDASKLNELYLQRLKNIYKMDLEQYDVVGLDENIKTQLKRALLSRGLHPS